MKCPVCLNPDLVMAERQGIEIDYCPSCRGVWLDRGELDKIIERAAGSAPQAGQAPQGGYYQESPPRHRDYDDDDHHHHHGDYHHGGYKKKRRGLLGEIFDFD